MLKPTVLSILFAFILLQANAQDLYMPRDIKLAYQKGTRSVDGRPGKNYWQNTGRYNISITANPPSRDVKGTEKITYTNNSPDTLKRLNMKLILNIHRPGAARFFGAAADYLTDGIQIDSFIINGKVKRWDNKRAFATNQPIALNTPLAPHDSVKLDIAWHFQLSKQSNRKA